LAKSDIAISGIPNNRNIETEQSVFVSINKLTHSLANSTIASNQAPETKQNDINIEKDLPESDTDKTVNKGAKIHNKKISATKSKTTKRPEMKDDTQINTILPTSVNDNITSDNEQVLGKKSNKIKRKPKKNEEKPNKKYKCFLAFLLK
jgi:hypothetical protein